MVFFIGIVCPNGIIQHRLQILESYFSMAFNNVHNEKQKQRVELLKIETRNIVNGFSHIGKLRKSVQL